MRGRVVPQAGMPVRVIHLGVVEAGVVEEVLDGGLTLVVTGERYTLRRINSRFVHAGEPWYGTRLSFAAAEDDEQAAES